MWEHSQFMYARYFCTVRHFAYCSGISTTNKRFNKHFESALLAQSLLMIFVQYGLLKICVECDYKIVLPSSAIEERSSKECILTVD